MILTGRSLSAAFLLLLFGLTGCIGIGPRSLSRDRFDYTTAISDSWKDQMLLKLVFEPAREYKKFMNIPPHHQTSPQARRHNSDAAHAHTKISGSLHEIFLLPKSFR